MKKGAHDFSIHLHIDHTRGESAQTPEPRSAIKEALWRLEQVEKLALQDHLLAAIAKDLDGALRDIRSAKMNIQSIAEDGEARDAFRKSRRR